MIVDGLTLIGWDDPSATAPRIAACTDCGGDEGESQAGEIIRDEWGDPVHSGCYVTRLGGVA